MSDFLRQWVMYILRSYRTFPKKSLGQNFLVSDSAVERLCAGLSKQDLVIEIGAGVGQITRLLAERVRWVIALEFDPRLVAILQKELAPFQNITMIQTDAARCDYRQMLEHFPDRAGAPGTGAPGTRAPGTDKPGEGKIKIIGNLPYYVAVPILIRLEEIKERISLITATLQKELAERMQSLPGHKTYGELSIRIQYFYDVRKIVSLTAEAFYPRPKVDSEVLALHPLKKPRVCVQDEKFFFRLVRSAFSQRRKTLLNVLKAHQELGIECEQWPDLLARAQLSPQRRAETLSIEEFARLSDLVSLYLASGVS